MDCIFGSRGQGHYRGAIMLDQITYFDLCKTFLERRSFCELVMMSNDPRGIAGEKHDITDAQFKELKQLAMRNILRGFEHDDVDFSHLRR